MAKASWCNVSPMSGSKNGTLTISAGAHGGRVARNTTVTVTAANGTRPSGSIQVSQAGAPVTLTIESTKPDVPKEGATFTVRGTSNSPKLTWKIADPNTGQGEYPNSYGGANLTVNGVAISSGVAIPGDPGAAGVYDFVATVTFKPSPFPVDVRMGLVVFTDTGNFKSCAFTIKAGSSTLSLSKGSISVPNGGGSDTVGVTSNDDWNVS